MESVLHVSHIDGLGPWNTNNVTPEADTGEAAELADVEPEHFHGDDRYEMNGPLVFRDYNGWNTGISIVNISEQTNDVDIQFFGTGEAMSYIATAAGVEFMGRGRSIRSHRRYRWSEGQRDDWTR